MAHYLRLKAPRIFVKRPDYCAAGDGPEKVAGPKVPYEVISGREV